MNSETHEQWAGLRDIFQAVAFTLGFLLWAIGTALTRAPLVLAGVGIIFIMMTAVAGLQLLVAKSTNDRLVALVYEGIGVGWPGFLFGLNHSIAFPASIPDAHLALISGGICAASFLFYYYYLDESSESESEYGGEHA